jgi:acyl carrier protein
MPINENEVMEFLNVELGVDTADIASDTPLFSSGVVDSFSMVSLITFIEERCQTRLNPMDISLNNMDTINGIVRFAARVEGGS